jgi:hypothetical protein
MAAGVPKSKFNGDLLPVSSKRGFGGHMRSFLILFNRAAFFEDAPLLCAKF